MQERWATLRRAWKPQESHPWEGKSCRSTTRQMDRICTRKCWSSRQRYQNHPSIIHGFSDHFFKQFLQQHGIRRLQQVLYKQPGIFDLLSFLLRKFDCTARVMPLTSSWLASTIRCCEPILTSNTKGVMMKVALNLAMAVLLMSAAVVNLLSNPLMPEAMADHSPCLGSPPSPSCICCSDCGCWTCP